MYETGLIIWTTGNRLGCLVQDEVHWVPLPGRWRLIQQGSRLLAPGDLIKLESIKDGWKAIETIPRRNEFTRRTPGPGKYSPQTLAANLDQVVIVASMMNPTTPNGLIDRLLVTAAKGGVPSVLLLNKMDLASEHRIKTVKRIYNKAVDRILFTSAVNCEGIGTLETIVNNKITLFAGSSGVGKSTLANCLNSELKLKTGEISRITGKGRHITSAAKLYHIPAGGWIIDTPGIRECGLWGIGQSELDRCFKEFEELLGTCHFRDCRHDSETGCKIKGSVDSGDLPIERYQSYLKLLHEIT